MSLLQEALKRKEEDESQRKPAAESTENVSSAPPAENAKLSIVGQPAAEIKNTVVPPDSPSQSMPVAGQTQAVVSQNILAPRSAIALPGSAEARALRPDERAGESADSLKPGHRKVSLLWVIVAVIAIFFGLIITAGTVFLFYRALSPVKTKTVQQAEHIDKNAAVAVAETNISAGQLTAPPKPELAGIAETTVHQSVAPAEKKEATAAIVQTQIVAVVQNAEANSVQQQFAGNAESKPTPTFFKPKKSSAVSQAARWPALKLMGILRGTGKAESTAFINGKMISTGQTIADVTIVEIQADGVILKYGNEKRFLRVGATSY